VALKLRFDCFSEKLITKSVFLVLMELSVLKQKIVEPRRVALTRAHLIM
jgi:hypothetical protein